MSDEDEPTHSNPDYLDEEAEEEFGNEFDEDETYEDAKEDEESTLLAGVPI